jgi:chromosome segregation ATPase
LAALHDQLASTESALAQRRLEAEQAGAELDAARAAHAAALSEERQRAAAQFGSLRDQLASTESALAQRRLEAAQAGAELDAARAAHAAELSEERQRAAAGLAALRDQLASTESALAQRRLEAEEAGAELAAARASHAAELEALRATHAAELTRLRADIDGAEAAKTAALKQASAEREAVEKRLKERFDEIATLTRLMRDAERMADANSARTAEMRAAAAREIGRTVLGLLDDGLWRDLPKRVRLRRQKRLLKRSGLFDADWYRRRYPDVAQDGMDPVLHYILFGANEGREPNGILAGEPVPGRA